MVIKTYKKFTQIEPAGQVPENWDYETDTIIVGMGGAGIAAALQARQDGLSVIGVDRFSGGGATQASGGVVYAGGGTGPQNEAGVADTVEDMYQYLKTETGTRVSDKLLRNFCDQSPNIISWLQENGVRFGSTVWDGKTSYPPPEYFLYHSDNSLLESAKQKATPAPRGHRGFVPIEQGRKAINLGGSIFNPLKASAIKAGMKTLECCEVRQLIFNPAKDQVIGIKALNFKSDEMRQAYLAYRNRAQSLMSFWPPILPGAKFFYMWAKYYLNKAARLESKRQYIYIRAEKAVILAAGGFAFNSKMMQHYAPAYAKGFALGTEADNGAGIELGQSVGGKVKNMERASAWRFINPPISFARGLIVNRDGQRFVNEMAYGATIGAEIAEAQNGQAWLILNKALVRDALKSVRGKQVLAFQRDLARLNIWFGSTKAKTLTDLAAKTGITADKLTKQVARYNEYAQGKTADPLGKTQSDLADLSAGPYYAINVSLDAKLFPCPTLTLGGLAVDDETGLVQGDGGDIKGLYAAGRNAVGICAHNYVSGLSIADGIFSGRRAAKHISRHKGA